MQKLRGSVFLPVVAASFCAQFENRQALRQPMQLIWSVRISKAFAGVTKINVESGVLSASVKPSPTQRSAASDRKSTRLNSSHQIISYAVFCLKKKIDMLGNSKER